MPRNLKRLTYAANREQAWIDYCQLLVLATKHRAQELIPSVDGGAGMREIDRKATQGIKSLLAQMPALGPDIQKIYPGLVVVNGKLIEK
jgi:hypothetical protein